jgi:ATP-dependent Clp protease ATP-binding subunit ClpC
MDPLFTDRARHAILVAHRAADTDYIGTAHLLLGILADPSSVAVQALTRLNIDVDVLQRDVSRGGCDPEDMPPALKRAIEEAFVVKELMNVDRVDCEHLLLALLQEGNGLAAQRLKHHGATFELLKEEIRKMRDERR